MTGAKQDDWFGPDSERETFQKYLYQTCVDGEEAPIYMGVRPENIEAYTKYIAALISSGFFLARLFDGARKNVRLAAYRTFL